MILVADNLQPMNPAVARALDSLDPEPIRSLARRVEQAGAKMLDVNPGFLSRRRKDRMAFMVEAVQEVSGLRLVLDSPDAEVLAGGLAVCRETPVINGLTLEKRRLEEVLPLAVKSGADLVVLLLDERSVAPGNLDDKMALALELWEHCRVAGLPLERLIFDPLLPNLGGPEATFHAAESIRAVRMLAGGALFQQGVRTMAGLSNLRSGLRNSIGPEVETTCLSMLAGAGLEYALADVFRPEVTAAVRTINRLS
jgi:cobalamin-dependent methionine synthase I